MDMRDMDIKDGCEDGKGEWGILYVVTCTVT
jgi:hypothetical protein